MANNKERNVAAVDNNKPSLEIEEVYKNAIRKMLDEVTPLMRASIADIILKLTLELNEQAHKETEEARKEIIEHFWNTINRIVENDNGK